MSLTARLATVAVAMLSVAATGNAVSFSFAGNFNHDNDVQLFDLGLLSASTITLQTWSYGGGIDAQGDPVLPGGFEIALQIFDTPTGQALGGPFLPGTASCPPNNPDPARLDSCQDVFGQILLPAGNYIVALTQFDNLALGNLSDGFFYVDVIRDPNFNNGFNFAGLQGTSAWELDILGVDSAAPAPEPASALLIAGAVLLAGIGAQRRRIHL
jgi:hypothetical protein